MKLKSLCALTLVAAGLALASPRPAAAATPSLRIIFVDVEGGQATLLITPTGQSMLIDTGWPGNNGRDANRIVAAARQAGLSRIDDVLLTHYHVDHAGGVPQLVARIPVGTFIDHGPLRETAAATQKAWQAYQDVLATGEFKHLVPKVGDTLPLTGLTATVVSSDGNVLAAPLPGAGAPNVYCAVADPWAVDTSENTRSLGVLFRYGQFTFLDLGDLTWNVDRKMMCPDNRLGQVSVLLMPNHGMIPGASHALVDGTRPEVIVVDNGPRKGGAAAALDMARTAPGLLALWQLHYALPSGDSNTAAADIANLAGPDDAYPIEVDAHADGSFSILNPRTKQTVSYPAR